VSIWDAWFLAIPLPADRVRYHRCWGSWHGPHANDVPLAHIADIMLRVNAGGYVIAGADCGFGSRIHPELGWAKLSALAEGAALASSRIWKA
jgi:hypothetical protein